MSDPITDAFVGVLRGDPALDGLLTKYFGVTAVFATDPVPEDAVRPYIQTAGNSNDFSEGTMDDSVGDNMRVVNRDIRCFADEKGAPEQIDDIALRVKDLFKSPYGQGVPIAGWGIIRMRASGPTELDPDTDTYGRVVEVEMTLERI